MRDDERDLTLLRQLLAEAGLDRTEAEVSDLLPGFRGRREAADNLKPLELTDTPVAVGFAADWRNPRSSDTSGGRQ